MLEFELSSCYNRFEALVCRKASAASSSFSLAKDLSRDCH